MKIEIEPPEFSNPPEARLDGMYSGVYANMSRRDFLKLAVAAVGALGLASSDALPPILTAIPNYTKPTSTEISPSETVIDPNTTEVTPTPTETPTQTPTFTDTPTEIPTPTETPLPLISENPAAGDLFSAKEGQIPEKFSFGGYEWTAATYEQGEKVWSREDGKVNFEWASLYGGGKYNAYMFVTRSEHVEGKRRLEIYTDPRLPIFYTITGNPGEIDTFVGSTVSNVMQGNDSRTALKQLDSTLKVIVGGFEYWPIGNNSGKPQDIYYYGSNGEILSQKIWGFTNTGTGYIGPFIEQGNHTVQCGFFFSNPFFEKDLPPQIVDDADVPYWLLSSPIGFCAFASPQKADLNSGGSWGFNYKYLKAILASEVYPTK